MTDHQRQLVFQRLEVGIPFEITLAITDAVKEIEGARGSARTDIAPTWAPEQPE